MKYLLIGALITGALIAVLALIFHLPMDAAAGRGITRLVYLLLWLVLISGGVLASRHTLGPHWLRNALLWIAIIVGLLGAVAMRDELGASLRPAAPRAFNGAVELRRAADGHFWADVEINGAPVRMMIDTGASQVALTPRDARRLGFEPETLAYTAPVATALGDTLSAPVTLTEVRLGPIKLNDVRALVMRENVAVSLLGMSFLDRLDGYEVRRDRLLLRPAP